jgi:hypothetical protein
MADGRKNNGAKKGENRGQGRKPKAEELQLIERLSPMDDIAFSEMQKGVKSGDFQYIKMFFEYRFGKPKQTIDTNVAGGLELVWNETKNYGK